MGTKQRDFLLFVTSVGVIYAVALIGLKALFGEQAVGIASIGLTTLATVAVKKYKDARTAGRPAMDPNSWWMVITLAFAFGGLQFLAGHLQGIAHIIFPALPLLTVYSSSLSMAVVILALSYIAGGFLAIKSAPHLSAARLAFAILISYLLGVIYQVDPYVFQGKWRELKPILEASAPLQMFTVFYVAAGLAPLFLARLLASKGKTRTATA